MDIYILTDIKLKICSSGMLTTFQVLNSCIWLLANSEDIEFLSSKFKFDTLGGTKIDDVRVSEGCNVNHPVAPKKSGYTFNGWYLDLEYTKPYNFSAIVTKDLVLYAYWI